MRKTGKIRHMCDERWKGLDMTHTYTWYRETAGLGKHVSPDIDMPTQAKTARNVSTYTVHCTLATFHVLCIF